MQFDERLTDLSLPRLGKFHASRFIMLMSHCHCCCRSMDSEVVGGILVVPRTQLSGSFYRSRQSHVIRRLRDVSTLFYSRHIPHASCSPCSSGSAPADTSSSCCSSASSIVRCSQRTICILSDACATAEVDGIDAKTHPFKSIILGGQGPFVPFPSHSFLSYMGPKVYMLMLDCRYVDSMSGPSSFGG